MLRTSVLKNSVAALALMSLSSVLLCGGALADNPPAKIRALPHTDPQVKALTDAAIQSIKQGNIPLATIQLKNALRLDPDNGGLRVHLGYVLLQSGDAAAAEREVRQGRLNGAKDEDAVPILAQAMANRQEFADILAQLPDPAPGDKSRLAAAVLRARALAFQSTGDAAAAISSMDRSLAIVRDVNGLLERARFSVMQGQPDAAIGFINQSLKLSPGNVPALLTKAAIVRIHDQKAALAIIDGVLKAHPDAANAAVSRIELLLEMKRVDEAQQTVDALNAKAPNLPLALFYKGIMLGLHNKSSDGWRIVQSLPPEFLQSSERIVVGAAQLAITAGNRESANSLLTTFVGQHPESTDARLRLAALRLLMNNPGYALEALQPLMNSTDPAALQMIAATYGRLKQPGKALDYMRKASAAGSKNPNLNRQLAVADLGQNNTVQGMQETVDLLKQNPGNLGAAVDAVTVLLRQSKFADAQAIAEQADKINPKNPIPAFLKGQILFNQKKYDDSLKWFSQSLQRDPHFRPGLFARAQIALLSAKYADAIKDLKQAQTLAPADPLSYVKLGEVAALQKQPAQAIGLLKQGITMAPKVVGTRIVLARYQVGQRQYPDALATLKGALQIEPNNGTVLALMGQVQQAMGQKAAAVGTNKTLTQKYQQSGAAQALLGNSLLANGDKKGALAAFKRATELDPDVQQYVQALIEVQLSLGDKAGALASAESWADKQKGPDSAMLLAMTLFRLDRIAEADTVITRALAVRPDYQLTIIQSKIALARGDRERSLSILKTWLAGHSTDLAVRQTYADSLLLAKQDAAALAQYEIFLKSRDDIPTVLNNAAWLLRDKNPGRALTLASKAALLQPSSPDISDTLGWLLLQKKDAKGALTALQRAHNFGPKNGEITYHLALAYDTLGQKAEAKQALQDALKNGGNFPDADEAKKMLQRL